jgi:hypothetical protein
MVEGDSDLAGWAARPDGGTVRVATAAVVIVAVTVCRTLARKKAMRWKEIGREDVEEDVHLR